MNKIPFLLRSDRWKLKSLLLASFSAFCIADSAQAAVIYEDDFSSNQNLHGTAPDQRPGAETWVANSSFKTNGSVLTKTLTPNDNAMAYLPFTVESGNIYQVSARMSLTDNATDTGWFGIGFFGDGFATNVNATAQTGGPWMLVRLNTESTNGSTPDAVVFFPQSNTDRVNFGPAPDGVTGVDVVLTLDTTAALWSVGLSVDGVTLDLNGAALGDMYQYTTNPNIARVGLTATNNITGAIDNFSLVAVPEPASSVLAVIGLSVLVARVRRRSGLV